MLSRIRGAAPVLVALAAAIAAGAAVAVYDALGRRVAGGRTDAAGAVTLDLAALPPGAYVVRLAAGAGPVARVVTKLD